MRLQQYRTSPKASSASLQYITIETSKLIFVETKILLGNRVSQNLQYGTLYTSKDAVQEEKYYKI